MARKDLATTDASVYERRALDSILKRREEQTGISPEEALKEARVFKGDDTRNITRVLFVSQDTNLLNPTRQTLDGYLDLKDLFDEVHILILRTGIPAKYPVLRAGENVWLYTASAKSWWRMVGVGKKLAEQELTFGDGFRPDLIVARDPFESALVAKYLAEKYNTPAQLHITEDYTSVAFKQAAPENFWRRFIPAYVLEDFKSIRVGNEPLLKIVKKRSPTSDLELLPRYYSYESISKSNSSVDLKQTYPAFNFFILYVGDLSYESKVYQALDGARFALHNPTVAMIIIGDGPLKKEVLKRAKILGVERQIIILPKVANRNEYLSEADILITPENNDFSNKLVVEAAAAGLPTIMSINDYRRDLFLHEVSAYLYDPEDPTALNEGVGELLNNPTMRLHMAENITGIIEEKFHQSFSEYRTTFRDSIEKALFVDDEENSA